MGKLKIDIISLSLKVKTNICRVIFLSNNCTNYGHPMIVFFFQVSKLLDWADWLSIVKSRILTHVTLNNEQITPSYRRSEKASMCF